MCLPLFVHLSRPVPDREFVEAYVKAYYLSEADMELWVKEHKVRGQHTFFWTI